jgi:hypothetical protein
MKRRINLDTSVVQTREQRLGTIVSWDGSVAELAKQFEALEHGLRRLPARHPAASGAPEPEEAGAFI